MSLLKIPHAVPNTVIFDWHATLVDTKDAMYRAVDDVLPILEEHGLIERLVKAGESKTLEDEKLVKYVRENARLHPRIKSERKVSRTDIFEVLFSKDEEAKALAHKHFDECYGKYAGVVEPFESGIRANLIELRSLGMKLGVISNRKREYMEKEIRNVESGSWVELFDTLTCGDDVAQRKPAPDLILKALDNLGMTASTACWYVGDSTTDVVAAKLAEVTAVFYNGAGWDRRWIDKIFPETVTHPHTPDTIINHFDELTELVALYRHIDLEIHPIRSH